MRCPLVHVCTFFVLGMAISDGLAGFIHIGKIGMIIPLGLFFICFAFSHWKSLKMTAYVSMALFCTSLGFLCYSVRYDHVRNSAVEEGNLFIGTVTEQPVRKPRTWAARTESCQGVRLLIYLKCSKPPAIGDTLTLRLLSATKTCPLDAFDNEYAPYLKHLFYSGISATAYSDSAHFTAISANSPSLYDHSAIIRQKISALYKEHGLTGDEGAVVEALTIGDKRDLPGTLRDEYSRAGVSHTLALSGYHLTLIYAILELLFLSRFVLLRWRWISRLCMLAFIWAFAWLTGMSPSLLRATIMITVMILSGIFYRNALSLNSLAIAAIIMLAANPLALRDIGFQLSYVSMIGILTVGKPLAERTARLHWLAGKPGSVIIITLTCSVFTAPLVAYYFGQVPLLSVVTNILLTVLIPVVLLLSIVWWLVFWSVGLLHYVTVALTFTVTVMNKVVDAVASVPWGTVEWHPNLIGITLFYILLCSVIGFFYYLSSPL